jgi:hypothetical protein
MVIRKKSTRSGKKKSDSRDEIPSAPAQGEENPSAPAQPRREERASPTASSGKSLARRIAVKTVKALFVWTPLCVIGLVALFLTGLSFYLTPQRTERLIISSFNSQSNGTISLNVRDFSLWRGFQFENILIRNGEEFGNTTFLEMEKLVMRYGLFPMLIGNVRVSEIGIYKPRVYLTERGGVWNVARLMKPGEPKPPEPEQEPEEPSPPTDEIRLPISVELLFRFILDDLRVYVNGSAMRSSLEGLTFGVDIRIPPFKRVPKSLNAVTILEKMEITLNPREEMNVSFYSREAEVSPPLVLTWKLIFNKNQGSAPHFESAFRFGTYRTPVRFRNRHLAPLNFMVSYDMRYEPLTDYLKLNHLGVSFLNRKLFNLAGEVRDVTKHQRFNIRMTESDISLDDLYPYYRQLTGDGSMRFGGSVSLFPLTVSGDPKDIDVNGEVNLRRILFRQPGVEATIPSLTLAYRVLKRGDDMNIMAGLRMPHLQYALERSRSGDNGLDFDASVAAFNGFERVYLNSVTMKFYNPASRRSALELALDGKVLLRPGQSGNIAIRRLEFSKRPLMGMLPGKFQKSLEGVPLKKPVTVSMNLSFDKGRDALKAVLDMLVKVPDFNVNDLSMALNMEQNERRKKLYLNAFHLGSREKNLAVTAKGVLDMNNAPGPGTDLSVGVRMEQAKMQPVYGDWNLSGKVDTSATVRGDMKKGRAFGAVRISDLNVKNPPSKMSIEGFNMNFPFEYYFTPRMGESRILVDRVSLIANQYFMEKENFTIRSIKAKHPARDISFEYMRDFAATMFFRNNTFEIEKLRAYVLGGGLYGRNILFNLMDMKPKNMEYKMLLDITNVDVGLLDEVDPAKKARDAELSLNANFVGRGVIGKGPDFSKELDVTGNINIYRIGRKFGNRLMKGLSEEQGQSKLGAIGQFAMDNSMRIKGFDFRLDKGLMYTTVTLARGGIGYLFGIKDEKVKYDRIPVQEFLSKVREE